MQPLIDHIVILTLPAFKDVIYHFLHTYCDGCRYHFVFSKEELHDVVQQGVGHTSMLVSFGTGVIVKKEQLAKFQCAYNFHPAPPEYPGLDPHHFAIYHNATTYGATCHLMTEHVDNGPIVLVRRFPVTEPLHSTALLEKAVFETFEIMDDFFRIIFKEKRFPEIIQEKWAEAVCTKANRMNVCTLDSTINKKEFDRIFHAFQEGVDRKNLVLHLHGHTFIYEGKI